MKASEEYFNGPITESLAADIKELWRDTGIKEAFERQAEFQLNDSAE
jgi:hypothetical protein